MDPCNALVGTIAYISPKQINTDLNNGKYDGCAGDIWSLHIRASSWPIPFLH